MAKIKGTKNNDFLLGTPFDDRIDGKDGDDIILGLAGNDRLKGGKGNDVLDGGAGNDEIEGGQGNDTIFGGTGNDEIEGGQGNDTIFGGAGNDEIEGGAGNDTILGGAGNDLIFGDSASGTGSGSGTFDDYLDGGVGNDILVGGQGNDTVLGGADDDILYGDFAPGSGSGKGSGVGSGSDSGDGSFDDYLDGGAGNDLLFAQQGDDEANYTLFENLGFSDVYDGGTGADKLTLTLTHGEFALAAVQADIAAFDAFLAANADPTTDSGPIFNFSAFDLSARNFEDSMVVLVNTAPDAVDDAYMTDEDTVLAVIDPLAGVLANDIDTDHLDVLVVASADAVSALGAAVSVAADGTFTYDPTGAATLQALATGESAIDSFTYTISDLAGATDTATVSITVEGVDEGTSNDIVLGPLFQMNTTTAGTQVTPDVATLTNGNVAALWVDHPPSASVVTVQLFDPTGAPVGAEFTVAGSAGAEQPEIAALPNGGFVIAWATGFFGNIFLQRFDANGVAIEPVQTVNSGINGGPEIAVLPDGSFMILYSDDGGGGDNVRGRIYDSAGVGGPEFAVATEPGGQGPGGIALLSDGNLAVSYTDSIADGSSTGIFLKIIQTDGTVLTAPIPVNTTTAGSQNFGNVAALNGGQFVVTWSDGTGPGEAFDIRGQIFNNDGTTAGGEFLINSTTAGIQHGQGLIALPDGGFFVAWQSDILPDGSAAAPWAIVGQQFDSAGQSVGGEIAINPATNLFGGAFPHMTLLADGSIFLAHGGTFPGDTDPDNAIVGRVISLNDSVGSDADETLISGPGDSVLTGGGGDDLFVFTDGSGNSTITDFVAGAGTEDVIDISDPAFGFSAFDDGTLNDVESAATQVGPNAVIQLDVDDSVTLLGVNVADLHADDFIV